MELSIRCSDFESNGWIPDQYSGFGEDVSPELIIEGICDEAVSMAITLDDNGHPLFPNYNHWLAWNFKPCRVIPSALPKGAVVENPIHLEQGMAYGKHCYRGPMPPFNRNHKYCFTVYILDSMLDLDSNSDKEMLFNAMDGHILQKAELYGNYQRKHK